MKKPAILLDESLPDDIRRRAAKAFRDREEVNIYLNDETGVLQWSIELQNDPEFWLESFPTLEEAVRFCKLHHLPVVSVLKE